MFLKQYCRACHSPASAVGGFNVEELTSPESLRLQAPKWSKAALRVRNGEMPPKGAPAPELEAREAFANWVDANVRAAVCAEGPAPGPAVTRRLNREEYSATINDLLDIHLDIGAALPADGGGGEGFDNAAETLFLSPLHAEKYLEAARLAVDFASKEFKPRVKLLIARPGAGLTEQQAARKILEKFLPRAFRRPVAEGELESYLGLFAAARRQGQTFEEAIFFVVRSVLVSPHFLFRVEPPNRTATVQPVDPYVLASRISYFLWGSMPDELLMDVAAAGKLHDPEIIRQLVRRMLRNERSVTFARRFVEQWLHTRELSGEKAPDPKLFPTYAQSEDLRSDIRYQPILFFRELLIRDLSLLNLIDSRYTIGTNTLARHLGEKLPIFQNGQQPQWVELPEGSRRGGLLGMPAVLAVSSHPYRTSPVLRGAWILENLLGTPPPPPPPGVPPLEEVKPGAPPKSLRERLAQHRAPSTCASCHARIDPWGFPLENFDVIGRWRDTDNGLPIDASAELLDGTKLNGPEDVKKALMARKDPFVRHLTSKLLGYALGRGLTLKDSCTVDAIVTDLRENGYRAGRLIENIILSAPFRYQAPAGLAQQPRQVSSMARKEQKKT